MEMFHVIKAGFMPMPNPTPSTVEAPRPTPTNVAPLTPEMQQQLETEGYVVLENFLTPDELEDLREFDRAHPLPEDLVNSDKPPISLLSSDLSYRQDLEGYFKMIAAPKIDLILPGYRTLFCPWTRRPPHANNKSLNLHQDPSFTDESLYACLGIWTPLSDVEIENSCICLVKGSHKLLPRKRAYTQPGLPFDREVQSYIEQNYLTYVPLKAGQAVLFDRRLVHGASPNEGNVERVAPTCLIIIPKDAPLYCIHAASIESGMHQIEIYEVDDNFYERSLFGEKPQGVGVTLIKTEPYTYDPLTLELIAEKLDPLHPDRAIPRLKTELATLQTHLEQSRSQLQGELTAANEQLHQKTTELASLKEDYSQTQAELEHLREQLQTTQTQHQQTQTELERDRTQLQQTEAELERDRTQLQQTQAELECDRTQLHQTQAELAQLELQQQQTQTELQQSQQQLQQTQAKLQLSDRQRQQTQAKLEQFQAELSQKAVELNQIKSEQHQARLAEIIRRRL
jgi:predicted  nucleic acid-binding Zn-ribbon protein